MKRAARACGQPGGHGRRRTTSATIESTPLELDMDAPLELASISGQKAQVCDAAAEVFRGLPHQAALVPWRETAISRFLPPFFGCRGAATEVARRPLGVANDAGRGRIHPGHI